MKESHFSGFLYTEHLSSWAGTETKEEQALDSSATAHNHTNVPARVTRVECTGQDGSSSRNHMWAKSPSVWDTLSTLTIISLLLNWVTTERYSNRYENKLTAAFVLCKGSNCKSLRSKGVSVSFSEDGYRVEYHSDLWWFPFQAQIGVQNTVLTQAIYFSALLNPGNKCARIGCSWLLHWETGA